ncbi:antitoxin family protein [Promineifilum sp.]|uniref:antitoxin family protein n=1 Tax=Promineifilum sp. TaxID=2664178 RepID=UPI0035B08509
MAEIITAVYEKGVLRPLQPLSLEEQEHVDLQILARERDGEVERLLARLVAEGILAPRPSPEELEGIEPISEEELRQLAEEVGRIPGKSLSEMVIEDRGEW